MGLGLGLGLGLALTLTLTLTWNMRVGILSTSRPVARGGVTATWGVKQRTVQGSSSGLGCHGTRYVRCARGWYAHPVRTVRGASGASRPAPPVRTQRGRLVRVARTYGNGGAGAYVSARLATATMSEESCSG